MTAEPAISTGQMIAAGFHTRAVAAATYHAGPMPRNAGEIGNQSASCW